MSHSYGTTVLLSCHPIETHLFLTESCLTIDTLGAGEEVVHLGWVLDLDLERRGLGGEFDINAVGSKDGSKREETTVKSFGVKSSERLLCASGEEVWEFAIVQATILWIAPSECF